eukprot:gene16168-19244_t
MSDYDDSSYEDSDIEPNYIEDSYEDYDEDYDDEYDDDDDDDDDDEGYGGGEDMLSALMVEFMKRMMPAKAPRIQPFKAPVPIGVVTKIMQIFLQESSGNNDGDSDGYAEIMRAAEAFRRFGLIKGGLKDPVSPELRWRCNLALVCKEWFQLFSQSFTDLAFRNTKDIPRLTMTLLGRGPVHQVIKNVEYVAFMSLNKHKPQLNESQCRDLLAAIAQNQTLREIKYQDSFVALVESLNSCLVSNSLRKLVINSSSRISDLHVAACINNCKALETLSISSKNSFGETDFEKAIIQSKSLVHLDLNIKVPEYMQNCFPNTLVGISNRLKSLHLKQPNISIISVTSLLESTSLESLDISMYYGASMDEAPVLFQQLFDNLEKNTTLKSLAVRLVDDPVLKSVPTFSSMFGKALTGNQGLCKLEVIRFNNCFDETLLTAIANNPRLVDISIYSSIQEATGMDGLTKIIAANHVQRLWFVYNRLSITPEFYAALRANRSLRELNFGGSYLHTGSLLKAIMPTNLVTVIGFDTLDIDAEEAEMMRDIMLGNHHSISCFKSFDPEELREEYIVIDMATIDELIDGH